MTDYYPPWGFYYKVVFDFSPLKDDMRFQSVSGLSVEYDMEEFKEGGNNHYTHKLPGRTKYGDLVLKRGMVVGSGLYIWCKAAFDLRIFKPAQVSVILMNEKGEPLRTWNIAHAIPKKWSVSDFNASENAVVIESLELTYRDFTVI